MKKVLLLMFALILTLVSSVHSQILINEIDSDQASTDAAEFIELYNTSSSSVSLNGMVLVLYNGSNDESYAAYDLDGYSVSGNGYFVIGAVNGADMSFSVPENALQNGADAVALYTGDDTDFPNGTAVTGTNLIDAVVYGTSDGDDAGLMSVLLNASQPQVDENAAGDKDNHSIQRNTDGAGGARNTSEFYARTSTPGASNAVAAGDVTLTTPNGGETYSPGETVKLQWTSTDVTSVYFEVKGEDGAWEKITDNIASVDGANSFDFTIPENAWSWDQYKIRVVDVLNGSVSDESDGTFTINGHDTEILSDDFAGGLGSWEVVSADVDGTTSWEGANYSGVDHAICNGYNAGANEDWLISPSVDMDNTDNEILVFSTASKYGDNNGLAVKYSTDYDGQGDPSSATWNDVAGYTLADGTDNWIHSGYLDMSSISGNVHIAFVYTCGTDNAVRWRVTDVELTGKASSPTAITDIKTKEVVLAPNPFQNELRVANDRQVVSAVFYNSIGQLVKEVKGTNEIPTADLTKGVYIIQVKFEDGSVVTQKVLKK